MNRPPNSNQNAPPPRRRITPVAVAPVDQTRASNFDVEAPLWIPPPPTRGSTKDISACGQGRRVWVDIQSTLEIKFKEVLRQQGLEYSTWRKNMEQRRAQLAGGAQGADAKRQGFTGQLYQRVQGLYEVSGDDDEDEENEDEDTGSERAADGTAGVKGEGDAEHGGSSGEHDDEDDDEEEEDDDEDDKEGHETGGEIDLDKEEEAERARGRAKPKRQRFERYDDDFIDDSELEMVKGAAPVKTKFSGFYITMGDVETLEEPSKPRAKPRPRAPKPAEAAAGAPAAGTGAAAVAGATTATGSGASRKRKQQQQQDGQQQQQQGSDAGGVSDGSKKKKRSRSETPAAAAGQDKPPAGKKAKASAAPAAEPQQPAAAAAVGGAAAGDAAAAAQFCVVAPAAAAAAAGQGGVAAKALAAAQAAKNKKAQAGSSKDSVLTVQPPAVQSAAAAALAAAAPATPREQQTGASAAAGGAAAAAAAAGKQQQQAASAAATAAAKPPRAPEPAPSASAAAASGAAANAAAAAEAAAHGGAVAAATAAGLPEAVVVGVRVLQKAVEEHKPPAPGSTSSAANLSKVVRHALDKLGYAFAQLPDAQQQQHSKALVEVLSPLMLPYMKERKLRRLLLEDPAKRLEGVADTKTALLQELQQQQAAHGAAGAGAPGDSTDEDFQQPAWTAAAEEALVAAWSAAQPVGEQLQSLAVEVAAKLGWKQGEPEQAVAELKRIYTKAKRKQQAKAKAAAAAGAGQGSQLQQQGSPSGAASIETVPSGTVSRQSPAPEASAAAAAAAAGDTPGPTPQKQGQHIYVTQQPLASAALPWAAQGHSAAAGGAAGAGAAGAAAGGSSSQKKDEPKFSTLQPPSPRLKRCLDAAIEAGIPEDWLHDKYNSILRRSSNAMHQVFRTLCLAGPNGCTVKGMVKAAADAGLGFGWEDNANARASLRQTMHNNTMSAIVGTTEANPTAYALLKFKGVQEQPAKQRKGAADTSAAAAAGGQQAPEGLLLG